MDLFRALVLGVVQGVTEFLPVSSSGHLVVVRRLAGWVDEGLAFDAALHLGTFLAVLLYFRSRWWEVLRGRNRALLLALAWGTLPAVLAGILGEAFIGRYFRSLTPIGLSFLVTGILLWWADRARSRGAATQEAVAAPRRAFLIGVAQAFALLPGLSRSGLTMSAGMLTGFSRPQAVEFSFLLALPITAAAGLEGLRGVFQESSGQLLAAAVGGVVAFAVGMASIAFLLRSIRQHSFLPYTLYLLATGVLVLLNV